MLKVTNTYSIKTEKGFVIKPNMDTLEYDLCSYQSFKWSFGNSYVYNEPYQDRNSFLTMCEHLKDCGVVFSVIKDTYIEIEERKELQYDEVIMIYNEC